MNDILKVAWSISDQAIESPVGDETVVLHLESGTYFGLDPIGTRIWELLQAGKAPSEICSVIATEFDAPIETVTADLQNFLHQLKENNLLREN